MRIIYRSHLRKFKLGRRPDERWLLIRTMLTQLMTYERIKTTSAKAKHLQATAERLIAWAKKIKFKNKKRIENRLHIYLTTKAAKENLMNNIVERLKDRSGSFTRVKFLHKRKGDGASVSYIEIIDK